MNNQLREIEDAGGLSSMKIDSWNGREFIASGKEYIDYASTNYLGFDFDTRLHKEGSREFSKWGSIAGWSRLEVDPYIYSQLEERLNNFIGSSKIHLSHTITITAFSIIPFIAGKGAIVTDKQVHTVIWEACRLARDHGAKLHQFKHQDVQDLARILEDLKDVHPKLIAVDGVYSISSEIAPVAELQKLASEYNAWLLIDDAHGFGILGEQPDKKNPYGKNGNGVARLHGNDFSRTFYLSSFGKAFCTYTAFATIPDAFTEEVNTSSLQYIFSAPPTPYMIGTVNASLDLNEKYGEKRRSVIRERVRQLCNGLTGIGCDFLNESLQPVVYLKIGELNELLSVSTKLWNSGVVAGLRAYPLVPEDQCGLRFALSALHTKEQIERTLAAIRASI